MFLNPALLPWRQAVLAPDLPTVSRTWEPWRPIWPVKSRAKKAPSTLVFSMSFVSQTFTPFSRQPKFSLQLLLLPIYLLKSSLPFTSCQIQPQMDFSLKLHPLHGRCLYTPSKAFDLASSSCPLHFYTRILSKRAPKTSRSFQVLQRHPHS